MEYYEEVKEVVNNLVKNTNIPYIRQEVIAKFITDELIRNIDFYTKKFYMIVTEQGRFVRYSTSSSGSKEIFVGMSPSSATMFDDIISCNEVLSDCQSKYPSEVFLLKSFEY